mgnify:CR=1 FL=1
MNKLEGNVFKAYYHQYFFDEDDVDLFNPTIEHWIFELHFIKSDAKDNWVYQTMITEKKLFLWTSIMTLILWQI